MTDVTTVTAEIVSAYVSKNNIPADEFVALMKSVHETVASIIIGAPEVLKDTKPAPAVPIKKSVQNDTITCLTCGMHLKTIKRHVMASHGQTLAEYKAYWSLPHDYPTTAPAYAEIRSALATRLGLGRKPDRNEPKIKAGSAPKSRVKTISQSKEKGVREKAA